MIVRDLDNVRIAGMLKKAANGNWESRRYLVRKDGLGFSLHHTIIYKGSSTFIWYKNHVEAVYCYSGEGEIEVVSDRGTEGKGVVHPIRAGTMYALDAREKHYLRATGSDMHMVCVFNPPIDGAEDHNEEGVYPVIGSDGKSIYDVQPQHLQSIFQIPRTFQDSSKKTSGPSKSKGVNILKDISFFLAGGVACYLLQMYLQKKSSS